MSSARPSVCKLSEATLIVCSTSSTCRTHNEATNSNFVMLCKSPYAVALIVVCVSFLEMLSIVAMIAASVFFIAGPCTDR